MNRRQREARYQRRLAHQRFCEERNEKLAAEGLLTRKLPSLPEASRARRRRLFRSGRPQWRGRRWKRSDWRNEDA